jgi:hypothetical protein
MPSDDTIPLENPRPEDFYLKPGDTVKTDFKAAKWLNRERHTYVGVYERDHKMACLKDSEGKRWACHLDLLIKIMPHKKTVN